MFGKDKNYYEILDIDASASKSEIKKAYFSAVRKYPPERFPEEFKKIREAYETLYDATSKMEYDAIINSQNAEEHFELGRQAYDNKDYQKAIEQLEIASRLGPNISFIDNLLGLSYMEVEDYKKAVSVFKKLTSAYSEKSLYHTHLGFALYYKGAYKQAKSAFEAALKLDNTDSHTWLGLSDCLFDLKDMTGSRSVLLEGINHCGENISFYLEIIRVDIAKKDMDNLKIDVDNLTNMAKYDKAMSENVAWALVRISNDAIEAEMFEYASTILEKAHEINPNEKHIKSMYNHTIQAEKLVTLLSTLKQEAKLPRLLMKFMEMLVLENENDEEIMGIAAKYENAILQAPEIFIPSIKYIKEHYSALYKLRQGFFDEILQSSLAKKLKDVNLIPAGTASIKDAKVGRNDPCPCGSGKKYKKCCIDK